MDSLLIIGWFIGLVISIIAIFQLVGFSGLTQMFPEGKRWWHLPIQLASLVLFASVVLKHPF